jgi:hypothetical protein
MKDWTYAGESGDKYVAFCELAATRPDIFKSFKSHPAYTPVLEHVGKELGQTYLNAIRVQYPHLFEHWDKFLRNDTVGEPNTENFVINSKRVTMSPTTIRYIKVLGDLQRLFNMESVYTLVEIGGGYGGQAFIIKQLFDIPKYIIYDLPQVCLLIDLYLEEMGIEGVETRSCDELKKEPNNLTISNYAFSELSEEVQLEYKRNIIDFSFESYFTVNAPVILSEDIYLTMPDTPITDIWYRRAGDAMLMGKRVTNEDE